MQERLRIDSSGNMLVGTTDTVPSNNGASGDAGAAISPDGVFRAARSGNVSLDINRMDSDGEIAAFRKDGTTVGSIASRAGVVSTLILNPASSNGAGLSGGTKAVVPADEAGIVDNDISLGVSTHRYKDLYLSGGAYIGGTAAANLFDDYEEGTWTPTVTPSGSGSISITGTSAKYTKIGNQVTVWLKFQISSVSSPTGRIGVSGVPFSATGQPYAATAHVNGFSTFSGKAGALVEASGTFNIDRYINGGISSNLADFAAASAYVFMTATYPVS
jgi:hypothetical protein